MGKRRVFVNAKRRIGSPTGGGWRSLLERASTDKSTDNTQILTTPQPPSMDGFDELNEEVDVADGNGPPANPPSVVPSHTAQWSDEKKQQYQEYMQTQSIAYCVRVAPGDTIIVGDGKNMSYQTARDNKKYKTKTAKVNLDTAVGRPFDTLYCVDKDGQMSVKEVDAAEAFGTKLDPDFLPTANNSELFATGDAQKLTHEDIVKMKKEGVRGDDLVKTLAANSKTFDSKTEFSQEKWIKKKKAKHSTDIAVLEPSLERQMSILDAKDPKKLMGLRIDTIAQILLFSNVGAHSQSLVVESGPGLLTLAVAKRQGGYGKVFHCYNGQQPNLHAVSTANLSDAETASICPFPMSFLAADFKPEDTLREINVKIDELASQQHLHQDTEGSTSSDSAVSSTSSSSTTSSSPSSSSSSTSSPSSPPTSSSSSSAAVDTTTAVKKRKVPTSLTGVLTNHKAALDMVNKRAFHTLILATTYDPTSMIEGLLPFLLPSSPFVIYSQYLEPLAKCQQKLFRGKNTVNLQFSETWFRHLQVLPNRTHPHMSMSATGGYILTGYKAEKY